MLLLQQGERLVNGNAHLFAVPVPVGVVGDGGPPSRSLLAADNATVPFCAHAARLEGGNLPTATATATARPARGRAVGTWGPPASQ